MAEDETELQRRARRLASAPREPEPGDEQQRRALIVLPPRLKALLAVAMLVVGLLQAAVGNRVSAVLFVAWSAATLWEWFRRDRATER
jgi:hypothetical protein